MDSWQKALEKAQDQNASLVMLLKHIHTWATHSAADGLVDWREVAVLIRDTLAEVDPQWVQARAAILQATAGSVRAAKGESA